MRLTTLLVSILGLFSFSIGVKGDTEIVNFHWAHLSSKDVGGEVNDTASIIRLSPLITTTLTLPRSTIQRFLIAPPSSTYERWTIRVSWPGSSPTKISITEPTPRGEFTLTTSPLSPLVPASLGEALLSFLPLAFRERLPLPSFLVPAASPPVGRVRAQAQSQYTILNILVEPLVLGFIPRTALPAIIALVVLASAASLCVRPVISFIEGVVSSDLSYGRREKES